MKKTMKRLAAITAAISCIAVWALPTFADYKQGEEPWFIGTEDDIFQNGYFHKTLTIYNDEDVNVYVPAVIYDYTIAPANVSTGANAPTVEDKDGLTATVQAGPEGGILLKNGTTIDDEIEFQFSNAGKAVTLVDGEYVVEGNVGIEFSEKAFEDAGITSGVFRYILTEDSDDYTKYGITRPTSDPLVRYIDVYVKEDEDGKPDIYGTVMFCDNGDGANTSIDIDTVKTNGFTGEGNNTGSINDNEEFEAEDEKEKELDPLTGVGDKLYTYNYVVAKNFKNDMIVNDSVLFTVSITNPEKAAQYFNYSAAAIEDISKYAADDLPTLATSKGTVNTDVANIALQDDNYLVFSGIPANCKIAVSEKNTNNAIYSVVASDDGTAGTLIAAAEEVVISNQANKDTAGFEAKEITNYASDTTVEPTTINFVKTTFTNTMKEISVTGVLFMVAPYAMMVAAAGFFLYVVTRSRKRTAEENVI